MATIFAVILESVRGLVEKPGCGTPLLLHSTQIRRITKYMGDWDGPKDVQLLVTIWGFVYVN